MALEEMTRVNLTLITERKNVVVKDNELIYHESVPAAESLAPIEKVNVVKAITFAEVGSNRTFQHFHKC